MVAVSVLSGFENYKRSSFPLQCQLDNIDNKDERRVNDRKNSFFVSLGSSPVTPSSPLSPIVATLAIATTPLVSTIIVFVSLFPFANFETPAARQ